MLAREYKLVKFSRFGIRTEDLEQSLLDSECFILDDTFDLDNLEYKFIQEDDVFNRKGLGKSCLEVYFYLSMHPNSTVGQIKTGTGRSLNTVKRCLTRMATIRDIRNNINHPLISKENGKYSALNEDLSLIAELLNVAGIKAARSKLYNQQRQQRIDWFVHDCESRGVDPQLYLGHMHYKKVYRSR
jgi:hypothetical protein